MGNGIHLKHKIIFLIIYLNASLSPTALAREIVPDRPKAIFYLNATEGCYSRSLISVSQIPYSNIKKLYRVSCMKPHHFEVFYVGSVPNNNNNDTGRYSLKICGEKFQKLRFNSRPPSAYNWSDFENFAYGNWTADTGPEKIRFEERVVCYASLGMKDQTFYKEVNLPMIKGFEKYEK